MASVEIVVPVYNEEVRLARCLPVLKQYLETDFPHDWSVTIANNGSTDGTEKVAAVFIASNIKFKILNVKLKGRGRALKQSWLASGADIVCYTDVDLSADLKYLPRLISALTGGNYDIAIGSRLHPDARIRRSIGREIMSRGYNLMIKLMFPKRTFLDAQCGFKAVKIDAARRLVPLIDDNKWFFDTELLLVATFMGYKVKEVPVEWKEVSGSTVKIAGTAWGDIKGLVRLRHEFLYNRGRYLTSFKGDCSAAAVADNLGRLRAVS